jgi:hypothetical protein
MKKCAHARLCAFALDKYEVSIIIVHFCTLYPRCTLDSVHPQYVPWYEEFTSVPKNRFLGSDFKSYLGIQYGTFLLRKKKIVLLYVNS